MVSDPDIFDIEITEDHDFLFMGCDGMFEDSFNEGLVKLIWMCNNNEIPIHARAGNAVDNALKMSAIEGSLENLTAIMICFGDMEYRK